MTLMILVLNLNFMIRIPSMNLNTTSVGQVFRPFRSAQLLFLIWPPPAVKLGGSEDFAGYQIPNSRALGVVSRLLPPSPCAGFPEPLNLVSHSFTRGVSHLAPNSRKVFGFNP